MTVYKMTALSCIYLSILFNSIMLCDLHQWFFASESEPNENLIVYPKILKSDIFSRYKRDVYDNPKYFEVGNFIIALKENNKIFVTDEFKNQYILDDALEETNITEETNCEFYTGNVVNNKNADAVVTKCENEVYFAIIDTGSKIYFVEPIFQPRRAHILYKAVKTKNWLQVEKNELKYEENGTNLNQNLFEIDREGKRFHNGNGQLTEGFGRKEDYSGRIVMNNSKGYFENFNFNNNKNANRHKRFIERSDLITFNLTGDTLDDDISDYAKRDKEPAIIGYKEYCNERNETLRMNIYNEDRKDFREPRIFTRSISGESINEERQSVVPTERWLELAVAVDKTMTDFYGMRQVKQYVMALMNIVSAVYQDSSLGANVNLVISRMYFYRDARHMYVRRGEAQLSLRAVNQWNQKMISTLKAGVIPHDAALWLTREEIGGPSGYAPVGGVCNSSKSTVLVKDEGLTSAFIITHELGHALGMIHDGDFCRSDTRKGSVMSAVVAATFRKFTWSSCSRRQFQRVVEKWKCLLNKPDKVYMENLLTSSAVLRQSVFTYSMDEQCRMEFGEGYFLCRNMGLDEPCSRLWCGHGDLAGWCKTKNLVPLDGSQCGHDKWCIDGQCQKVDKKLINWMSAINDRYAIGEWSDWGRWTDCISVRCGFGVRFRTRKCQSIRGCQGTHEQIEECKTVKTCSHVSSDLRASQCTQLPEKIQNRRLITRSGVWLPYPREDASARCKLNCVNWVTEDVIFTGENVADGTLCSYDDEYNVCYRGKCKQLECIQNITTATNSKNLSIGKNRQTSKRNQTIDYCGVCGGSGSTCDNSTHIAFKTLKRDLTRVFELPKMSRLITLSVHVFPYGNFTKAIHYHLIRLVLEDSKKNQYLLSEKNWNFISGSSVGLHPNLLPLISKKDSSIVLEGALLNYRRFGNKFFMSSKGPLQKEVTVYVYSPATYYNFIHVSAMVNFTQEKGDRTPNGKYRWSFIKGAKGVCSSSCGGGMRSVKPTCIDTFSNHTVAHRKCSVTVKPNTIFESCNNFSCNFHWVNGEWENCNKTCGPKGFAHREVYCLPVDISSTYDINGSLIHEPWRNMVVPNLCGNELPSTEMSCNRFPCPTYWVEDPWTTCSVTCGRGISYRPLRCPAPPSEAHYICGPRPPHRRRWCYGPPCNHGAPTCANSDENRYCQLAGTARYCVLPPFKRTCCESCKHFIDIGLEKVNKLF